MQVKSIAPLPSFSIKENKEPKDDPKRNKKDQNPSKKKSESDEKKPGVAANQTPEPIPTESAGQIVDSESLVELLGRSPTPDPVRESQRARQKYTAVSKQQNNRKS